MFHVNDDVPNFLERFDSSDWYQSCDETIVARDHDVPAFFDWHPVERTLFPLSFVQDFFVERQRSCAITKATFAKD